MATNGSRSGAPIRRALAAVLGAVAVFVIFFGAGNGSWAVAALGVALLVLAIGLAVANMVRRGPRAWVAGTAHVVSASEPPAASAYGRCELQIVVDAPGIPTAAVKVRDPRVPVAKWPDAGMTLPVMVAAEDIRHVRIQWDDVPTHNEAATATGEVPPEYGEAARDLLADDPLVETADPPWASRPGRPWRDDPWSSPPTATGPDPVTADLSDQLGDLRDEPVVRETSDGQIVVEGTLVGADADPAAVPLPRRGTRPRPYRSTERAPAGNVSADQAGASAPESAAATGTAVADPPADTNLPADADPPGDPSAATEPPATDPPTISGTDLPPQPRAAQQADAAAAGAVGATGPDDDDLTDGVFTAYPSGRTGATGAIHGVGITVLVTSLDRSVAFYRDLLGFHEIDGGTDSAVLASGDTRLVLRQMSDSSPIRRRPVHLNLEVGDVEQAYRDLRDRGIAFTSEPVPVGRGGKLELWEATFNDPDGHDIALTQWRAIG